MLRQLLVLLGERLSGLYFYTESKRWKEIERLSSEEVHLLSKKNLEEILKYSNKHVPFYKKIHSTNLKNFPIVTKNEFNSKIKDFI